jgi:hypothetical protein
MRVYPGELAEIARLVCDQAFSLDEGSEDDLEYLADALRLMRAWENPARTRASTAGMPRPYDGPHERSPKAAARITDAAAACGVRMRNRSRPVRS